MITHMIVRLASSVFGDIGGPVAWLGFGMLTAYALSTVKWDE